MLSISIVTYKSDLDLLQRLLCSLDKAINNLSGRFIIDQILIIDNSNFDLRSFIDTAKYKNLISLLEFYKNPKNVGYGAAHNIAIRKSNSKYHLILNPDLLLAEDNLNKALHFMEENPSVAAISPYGMDEMGKKLSLAKNYPTILIFFLRILPFFLTDKIFMKKMAEYENAAIFENNIIQDVLIVSGCYMLCRREILDNAGLFNEEYFLYFEDFALSLELNKFGRLVYHPYVKIVHFGGNTSSKGLRHIIYFMRSAVRFFNKYGWKII